MVTKAVNTTGNYIWDNLESKNIIIIALVNIIIIIITIKNFSIFSCLYRYITTPVVNAYLKCNLNQVNYFSTLRKVGIILFSRTTSFDLGEQK